MTTKKFALQGLALLMMASMTMFTSCSKEDIIVSSSTDLAASYVGSYTGVYTSANGGVTLNQKLAVTRLSNTQIKVENNGGPFAVSLVIFNLSKGATTATEAAGIASDGSTIAQSSASISIAYASGASFAGNK
jgi:hypothetical protein